MIVSYGIWLLFLLGSLGRISVLNQLINVYLYELLYFPFIVYLIVIYRKKPLHLIGKKSKLLLFTLLLWVLLGLGVTSFNATSQSTMVALLYFARLLAYVIGGIYVYFDLQHSHVVHKRIFQFSGFGILALSAMQYFFYPNLRNLQYLGWDPHQYRLVGTFLDVYVAATLFGLYAIHFLIAKQRDVRSYLSFLVFFGAGILTFSRSFLVASLVAICVYLLRKAGKWLIGGGVLLFLITSLIIVPKPSGEGVNLFRTASIESRVQDYAEAIQAWSRSPILGIGYNRIRDVKKDDKRTDVYLDQSYNQGEASINHAGASYHSSFLVILVTTGFVGFILSLVLLYSLAHISLQASLVLIFLSIMSLFDNVLLHPFILFVVPYFLQTSAEVKNDSKRVVTKKKK